MTALFILWGKNHVWILLEASIKIVLDNSDSGIKEKQATVVPTIILHQNATEALPFGLDSGLFIGVIIDWKYVVDNISLVIGIIIKKLHTNDIRVNNSFQNHIWFIDGMVFSILNTFWKNNIWFDIASLAYGWRGCNTFSLLPSIFCHAPSS